MVTLSNIYYLRYFVDAVNLKSISKAAEKNLVSHPAISKAIRILEAENQLNLINHKKKRFEVTQDGLLFALQAQQLLVAYEKIGKTKSSKQSLSLQRSFKVGLSNTISDIYLPRILKTLTANYPQLKFNIYLGTTDELGQKVLQEDLDLCITIGKPSSVGLDFTSVKTGQFVLIQNQNFKGNDQWINSIITTELRPEVLHLHKSIQKKYKCLVSAKIQIESWRAIAELVSANLGVGLVPDLILEKNLKIEQIKQSFYKFNYAIYISNKLHIQNDSIAHQLLLKNVADIFI